MRAVRHRIVWSFLIATIAAWIVPIAPSSEWRATILRTAATDVRPDAYDAGDSAVVRGPSPWLASTHVPVRAPSFATFAPAGRASTHASRRFSTSPTTSDRRHIPLYSLFRVYRI